MSVDEVPRSAVAEVISRRATESGTCGICNGQIMGSTSLEHERECSDCGTCYKVPGRTDGGDPEYEVEMHTIPSDQIERTLRKKAWERSVAEAMNEEGNEA